MSTVIISGLTAGLSFPGGLAIHPTTGNLFVSDNSTGVGRIISISMTSPTTGTATVLYTGGLRPYGLTVTPAGQTPVDLIIAEDGLKLVRRLRLSDNKISTVAGGGDGNQMGHNGNGDGGWATDAVLEGAKDVAHAGDGSLLIPSGNSVRRVDKAGVISTIVGPVDQPEASMIWQPNPSGTIGVRSTLMVAWGVAVDSRGVAYVVERDAPRVRRISCT
jgi:hypothetical protein